MENTLPNAIHESVVRRDPASATTSPTTTGVRDAVGAMPLYFSRDGRFGECPQDLRSARPGLCLPALRDYLTCSFVPGRSTLFDGVEKVLPGESVTISADGQIVDRADWWRFNEGVWDDDAPIESHASRLRPLLENAVAKRLPPGQPVGVYLSGGLDSSLVTALVKRLHDGPVHTFAIHFGADYPSELPFSQTVADHCGTIHHVLEIPVKTIERRLAESLRPLHDPIGDPLTTPNFLLGEAAHREGLNVIFNGEGGDPVFGGPKNLPMLLHALYDDATDATAGDIRTAYFRSYQKCYDDLAELLNPDVHKALAAAPPQTDLLSPFLDDDKASMQSYLNRLMLINVRLKGADQILTKVAAMTGHFGISGQSPLFDPDIVAAGFAIPPRYKLDGVVEKAVLKQSVADLLPVEILNRPKSGMMVPVQRWFRRDLNRYAKSALLSRRSRIRPYLNQRVIRDWLDYKPMRYPRHGVKIWLVLTLELWLRDNGF